MGTEDAKLTAKWNPITYQVAYHGNGATSGTMSNSTHIYDVAKNLTKNAYVRGYQVTYNYKHNGQANTSEIATATFDCWEPEAGNVAVVYRDEDSVINLCNTQGGIYNLYASWTLGRVTLPTPTRAGHSFVGWSRNENADTIDYRGGDTYIPERDTKLYAVWEAYSATVTFTKRDSITGEILNGATFGLYEWNGSTYERKSTLRDNGNGTYTTELMIYTDRNAGKYKIKEETAPTYYTNTGYEKEIILTEAGRNDYTIGYDMTNEPNKVKVKAIKVDSETGNRISGVTFTIYEWNKERGVYEIYARDVELEQQGDRTYLSDWLYANKNNEGKFKIVETGTPEGYYGDFRNGNKKENEITITQNINGQTIIIENGEGVYKNTRVKGTIKVNKIDKETKRYLAQGDGTLEGAEYGLYAAEDIYHKDTITGKIYSREELIQTETIRNGTLTYENVEIGKYYIRKHSTRL